MLSSFHQPNFCSHKRGSILSPGSESYRTFFVSWGMFPALCHLQNRNIKRSSQD